MKKILLVVLFTFISIPQLFANEKIEIKLNKCVDGDTAKFIINEKIETVRFLAIDTPELVKDKYGNDASDYTCSRLKSAVKIELEKDKNSDKYDKYNRLLGWIWVDDKLLQSDIIKEGYGKVAYLYGNYSHTDRLKQFELQARENKIRIWENQINKSNDTLLIIVIIILSILAIIFKKYKKIFYQIIKILKRR